MGQMKEKKLTNVLKAFFAATTRAGMLAAASGQLPGVPDAGYYTHG